MIQQIKIRIEHEEQETCSPTNTQIDDKLSEAIREYDEFHHGHKT
jgi:hypothetical protein